MGLYLPPLTALALPLYRVRPCRTSSASGKLLPLQRRP